MKRLTTLFSHLYRQYGADGPLPEQVVAAVWTEIVGGPLARRTRPVKISRSKLVVLVASSTWKQQLSVLRGEIVRRLNQLLGIDIVRVEFRIDSRVEQAPRELSQVPPKRISTPVELPLQGIADEELRDRIQAAAAACLDRCK